MPYSAAHKRQTRARIVEAARVLFNRHGFENVSIDMIMHAANLTRGGFYNHFKTKEALYAEAVASFLMGRGAQWREEAGVHPSKPAEQSARLMIESYLSDEHLGDLDGQCPMIAMPSDVARANLDVRQAYQSLLEAMVNLLEQGAGNDGSQNTPEARDCALTMAALCVGGMVLARSLPDSELAAQVRQAALGASISLMTEGVAYGV